VNLGELKTLIDLCLEKKIRHLRIDNIDVLMDDTAFQDSGAGVKPGPEDKSLEMPSDDELLGWSSPVEVLDVDKN
jgi:hypothetical protein